VGLVNNFWEGIEHYRKLGFDPLRWLSTSSCEADPHVLASVLQEIKKSTVKVAPSWFDAYLHIEGKEAELTRRVYDFANPVLDREVEVKRALALFRVHTGAAESPRPLSDTLQKFFGAFHSKVSVANAQVALTEHTDAQFGLLDYTELRRGDKDGYMPALTAFVQVTDVTAAPDADLHVRIALTDAIERLNLLGCGNPATYKFFPIYDAPSEGMLDRIRTNLDAFTARYNLVMVDYSSLKRGRLFYGTSATAVTNNELPTRYDLVEEGMEVMVTNRFGGLDAVSLHTLALMEPANADRFEKAGVPMESINAASAEALKSLGEPHFALGKTVAKYCPRFGMQHDKGAHIAAVYPVGSRGILAVGALAELANAHIAVKSIPVRNEEIARLATREFLVENATASQHGCHLIVGTREVLDLVEGELRQHHFAPERIGTVGSKGSPSVSLPDDAGKYVASKAKLARLVLQAKPAG
jgi:selenophosphate synthase